MQAQVARRWEYTCDAPVTPTASPTATIDANALYGDGGSPLLSGNASNATSLRVTITTISGGFSVPGTVTFDQSNIAVANGRWSVVGSVPSVGSYTVRVYSGATLLTSGTLVIEINDGGSGGGDGGGGGASSVTPNANLASAVVAYEKLITLLKQLLTLGTQ